jgi:hypothetical protein
VALLVLAALLFAQSLDTRVAWSEEESWDERSAAEKAKSGSGGVKPAPADTKAPAAATPAPAATKPPAPPPSTPAPTPDFAKQLEEAKKLLKETPEGAAIVKFLEDTKMPVEYDSSDGYYYHPTLKKIVLDANTAELMALKLAHEANHAMAAAAGKTPDINKETRDDYVRKMLEEEVVGTVGPIELKLALAKKGKTITATFPLEGEYVAAYNKAVEDIKKSNPSATDADLEAAGRKAGYEAVKKGFETGKVVASVKVGGRSLTYPEYYGKSWDDAHPRPTK